MSTELSTYGYLRDMLNDEQDYTFIIAIIIMYKEQGFARYFQETVNEEFMKEMEFGDLVTKSNGDIMVLNQHNELQKIGYGEKDKYNISDDNLVDIDVQIDIPPSICHRLTNAVSFYSKVNKYDSNIWGHQDIQLCFNLSLSHDDGFIIDSFGGPLKAEYESIEYYSEDGEFWCIIIGYTKTREKDFDEDDLKQWNHKDIIKFHEIRLDKKNMTKITVKGKWLRKVRFVSNLWEWKDGIKYQDYVGPKDEEAAMINEITEFYVSKVEEVDISIEEVTKRDVEMYEDDESSEDF